MYKNIAKETRLCLADLVDYSAGQVVSKTLVQNEKVSMTIFSFDKGEEISSHSAGGDAMVTILDGKGKFTVGGVEYVLEKGSPSSCPRGSPTPYSAWSASKCSSPFLSESTQKIAERKAACLTSGNFLFYGRLQSFFTLTRTVSPAGIQTLEKPTSCGCGSFSNFSTVCQLSISPTFFTSAVSSSSQFSSNFV